jgi:MFS family permease
MIPGTFRPIREPDEERGSFKAELAEGVRWLMAHPVLKPMAIMLGLMNAAGMISQATFVLFAQEVLDIGPALFAVIGFGAAIGGLIGGNIAPQISKRVGSGTALAISIVGMAIPPLVIGLLTYWPVTLVMFALEALFGILWNVITVSLRQSIIPERLLGRVNSVYRFFAWGMMPIGAALGGVLVFVLEGLVDRETALRATWIATSLVYVGLFIFGRAKLTTEKIEAARAAGASQSAS